MTFQVCFKYAITLARHGLTSKPTSQCDADILIMECKLLIAAIKIVVIVDFAVCEIAPGRRLFLYVNYIPAFMLHNCGHRLGSLQTKYHTKIV